MEVIAMQSFKCRNTGKKCRFEVEADTEDQVMAAAVEHTEKEHENGAASPQTIKEIRKAIRNERPARQ
jgi:predicted small metal-binding protein